MYYLLGIAAGAVSGLVILYLIIRKIRRATHQEGILPKYDERQQIARGKGYKFGFFTMLILDALAMCLYSAGIGIPGMVLFLGIFAAGLLVYISYAIWANAYIGLNETFRSSVILIGIIGAVNLALGTWSLTEKSPDNGIINLAVGAMMIVICIEMIAKNQYDRHYCSSEKE